MDKKGINKNEIFGVSWLVILQGPFYIRVRLVKRSDA